MPQARFLIMIPTHDNLGQKLQDLATVAHEWLYRSAGIKGSRIEGPSRGNWADDPQETFYHLVTVTDDTPENDSYVKQLAVHIGELANQWAVHVEKDTSKQIQEWNISNPNYEDGAGADPKVVISRTINY
jgi:hypothetical protein